MFRTLVLFSIVPCNVLILSFASHRCRSGISISQPLSLPTVLSARTPAGACARSLSLTVLRLPPVPFPTDHEQAAREAAAAASERDSISTPAAPAKAVADESAAESEDECDYQRAEQVRRSPQICNRVGWLRRACGYEPGDTSVQMRACGYERADTSVRIRGCGYEGADAAYGYERADTSVRIRAGKCELAEASMQ
eukprot:6199342-Pleurochrysis_carterae.AAC.1